MKRLLVLLLFCALPVHAGVTPSDFAWKLPLSVPPGGALYELPLPLPVYRGIRTPDLADLSVFNGAGEMVPFSLSVPPAAAAEKRLLLPVYPLPSGEKPAAKLSVRVEQRPATDVVSVERDTSEATAKGFLIDATSTAEPVTALELEWGETGKGFITNVTVDASNDLDSWRRVATGTLASLRREGEFVERRRLDLGGVRARYFRVVPLGATAPMVIKVTATLSEGRTEPHREHAIAAGVPIKEPGAYRFDLPGMMPVDRLRILLPHQNSLVRVALFSRSGEQEPWVPRAEGIAYRLNSAGGEVESPEFTLPRSGDRQWLARFQATGGGIGSGTPRIEVGWVPHRLRFVLRGDGPFCLAYGSGRGDTRSQRGADLFASLADVKKGELPVIQATAGEEAVLAGEGALKVQTSPAMRKKLLLWGSLLAGVALLAWMALRLSRQMKQ